MIVRSIAWPLAALGVVLLCNVTLAQQPAPAAITTPDLTGHSLAEAQATLHQLALGAIVRNPQGAGPRTKVFAQFPPPGTQLHTPTAIILLLEGPASATDAEAILLGAR